MRSLRTAIVAFMRDEKGLTMVEYAIAGALVTAAAVAAFTLLGANVATQIDNLADSVIAPPVP
jgi:pilus assembly protein Flp/PilA